MKTEISSASLSIALSTASSIWCFNFLFEQTPVAVKTSVLGITQPVTDQRKFLLSVKIFHLEIHKCAERVFVNQSKIVLSVI